MTAMAPPNCPPGYSRTFHQMRPGPCVPNQYFPPYRGYGQVAQGPPAPAQFPQPAPPQRPLSRTSGEVSSWWGSRTTTEQAAMAAGGVVVALGLAWLLTRSTRPESMRPNLRRAKTVRGKRRRAKRGKIMTVKGGRRFGHQSPPKRYWKQGARRASDYAWPKGYKYPLVFRTKTGKVRPQVSRRRTRAAASYFARNKHLYPVTVRRTIARNINKAKRKLGIGGKPATP